MRRDFNSRNCASRRTLQLGRMESIGMSEASRIEYWRQKAREAETDFYRLSQEQKDLDAQVTALVDFIAASRQLDNLETHERYSWIYGV